MKKITWLVFVVLALIFVPSLPSGVSDFARGDGSSENPYQINNCTELQDMNNGLYAYYILVNDIDCSDTSSWNSGAGFVPIGNSSSPFSGTFDGQNHKITGLFINWPSTNDIGLFGYTVSGAVIKNVGLVDVNIIGGNSVGGLVGWNFGDISNSYTSGSVSGSFMVGGLVGWNIFGNITNSYSTGSVSGSGSSCSVGGLVGGNNNGAITNSFATGSVSGSGGGSDSAISALGGLVGGNNNGAITNSFATGSVSAGDYSDTHVGGLVGHTHYGTITNSYSTGSVSGNCGNVGGLVGASNRGIITNSYSTGSVTDLGFHCSSVKGLLGQNIDGTITDSYWDIVTSGQSTSAGGTGKTTAEMMQQATFAGWDYATIWAIKEGVSYPYFVWQIPPSPPDNTQPGTNVTVTPDPNVTIAFNEVIGAGNTTVTVSNTNPGSQKTGFKFLGTYYDISTTATYSGPLAICLTYNDSNIPLGREERLKIFHWDGTDWIDVTFSLDTVNNIICAQVFSLSWFAVAYELDSLAPTTNISLSGTLGNNGWYVSNVQVALTATDNEGGSGVAKTEYSFNGITWNTYSAPIMVSTEGTTSVYYRSTDNAGNIEETKTKAIKIDKTLPVVTITATPNVLWPANNKMTNVKIDGSVADKMSGISDLTFKVKDEYGKVEPNIPGFGSVIQLEASRDGNDKDGRVYTIIVTATDKAGNEATASVTVLVPHDQGI